MRKVPDPLKRVGLLKQTLVCYDERAVPFNGEGRTACREQVTGYRVRQSEIQNSVAEDIVPAPWW